MQVTKVRSTVGPLVCEVLRDKVYCHLRSMATRSWNLYREYDPEFSPMICVENVHKLDRVVRPQLGLITLDCFHYAHIFERFKRQKSRRMIREILAPIVDSCR